jgi:outer membrane protein TolC
VSASLDLFTGGRRGAQRSVADADSRAMDAGWVFTRYATILTAKRGYFALLRGRELVRVAEEFVAVAELGLTYAADREATGTATRSDVLRARLALAAARRQWLAARDTFAVAGAALGRLVGADGPVDAEPLASLDPTPLALSDSALGAMAPVVAPQVAAADAQAAAGSALVRVYRSQYIPTISAGAGYSWANTSTTVGTTRPGWAFAITTSFPLFNGFVREASVTQAEAAAEVARVASFDTRRFVRAETQRLLGSIHLAEQDIALTRESVRLAREDLRVIQARYRSGIATILDVLTSQTAFVQSELDLVSAQFTYQVARASLEALVGRDL